MKKCKNCAWYCHSDGKCYWHKFDMDAIYEKHSVPAARQNDYSFAVQHPGTDFCMHWVFDGLEEWEREACKPDALVTVEMAAA